MTAHILRVVSLSLLTLLAVAGCQQEAAPPDNQGSGAADATAEVDPHDIPLTEAEIEAIKTGLTSYPDAMAKIKGYRDAIRDAIAAGNPPEAHRPLDELDITLEYLPTFAREINIPKSEWETINTSAQRIRELFNQVHTRIDAGEKPDFEGVSGEVDSQIASLDGVATS